MEKWPLILLCMIPIISSCSHKVTTVIDPIVPPPVRASDDVRCWIQENYGGVLKDVPGMHIWLREQEVQERRLREYYAADPIDLPPAECEGK